MSNVTEILRAEFELLRQEIIAAYNNSGMAATGNWGENVQVQVSGSSASITAPDYINGRKPGTAPPSEAIEKWIVAKGISAQMQKDITVSSLAYLISRKIAREGWQPKQENLIENIATPARIQQIIDKAGDSCLTEFTKTITNYLKTITA